MNVVALRGRLSRPAQTRVLPSGDQVVQLEVTVRRPDENERADTVPVTCAYSTRVATLDVDDEVIVVGRVRRRFFRAGGSTQSRTEVVADEVLTPRMLKKVATALEQARLAIGEPEPAPIAEAC
jgi:single-strand DNA-binding protein